MKRMSLSIFLLSCILGSGAARAALQEPIEVPLSGQASATTASDCEATQKKAQLAALQAKGHDAAAKEKAVQGMVQLGQLPADKVEAPLEQAIIAPPASMETCK